MRTFLFQLAVPLHGASVNAQPLRALTAGAFKQVVIGFVPAFAAAHGIQVEAQNDITGALLKHIAAGEAFDAV